MTETVETKKTSNKLPAHIVAVKEAILNALPLPLVMHAAALELSGNDMITYTGKLEGYDKLHTRVLHTIYYGKTVTGTRKDGKVISTETDPETGKVKTVRDKGSAYSFTLAPCNDEVELVFLDLPEDVRNAAKAEKAERKKAQSLTALAVEWIRDGFCTREVAIAKCKLTPKQVAYLDKALAENTSIEDVEAGEVVELPSGDITATY